MPIVAPDKIGFTDIGQSSISPRMEDTYVQPAKVEADQTLGMLADAASKMGVKVTGYADKASTAQQDLESKKTDYYVAQVRTSIKENQSVDAQINAIYPQQVPATRAEISRKIGVEHGQEFIRQRSEAIMSDPRALSDPEWAKSQIDAAKAEGAARTKGDYFYGNGFAQGLNASGEALQSEVDQRAAGWYKDQATDHIANKALQGTNAAASAPGVVSHQTVADAPDQFPVLKAATTGNGSVDGLSTTYAGKLQTMLQAAQAAGVDVKVFSGYRSEAKQASLYNDKVQQLMAKGQTQAQAMNNARKWVAPPGESNHNRGEAVDLKYGKGAQEWVHANAEKYGLYFPMGHEPWHIEQIGGYRQTHHSGRPNASDTGDPVPGESHGDLLNSAGVGYNVNAIAQAESGGRADAQNSRSSAGGIGGFIDSTWNMAARQSDPSLNSKSDAEVLAMKKDTSPEGVAFQKKVLTDFTNRNGEFLRGRGIAPTGANLYIAHTLGNDGALKVIGAADNVPLKQLIGAKAMAANPQWTSMNVGQYKQWATQKMGQPVNSAVAAQNEIRRQDYVNSRTLPIPDMVRRDIYAKTLLQAAQSSADPSFLDRMPPEYMSPQVQMQFQAARKQIADYNYQQDSRAREAEAQKRADTIRAQEIEINTKLANGERVDPKDYMGADPVVFEHAQKMMNKDLTVNPEQATMRRVQLMGQISAAGIDPSKWGNVYPQFKDLGRAPTDIELMNAVHDDPNLNTSESNYIYNNFQKTKDIGSLVTSPDAYKNYLSAVDPLAKRFDAGAKTDIDTLTSKLEGDAGVSYSGEAKTAYDNVVENGIKSYVAANGKVPEDMTPIYEKASKVAIDHIKLLKEHDQRAQELIGKDKEAASKALEGEKKPPIELVLNRAGQKVIKGSPQDDAQANPTGVPSSTQHPAPAEPVKTGHQEGEEWTSASGTKLVFRNGDWASPIVPLPPPTDKQKVELAPLPPKQSSGLRPRPSSKELRGPQSGDTRMNNGQAEVYKLITIGRSSRYEWVPK
jgi:LAS superfamily LD-carboxypeptidase LdcB